MFYLYELSRRWNRSWVKKRPAYWQTQGALYVSGANDPRELVPGGRFRRVTTHWLLLQPCPSWWKLPCGVTWHCWNWAFPLNKQKFVNRERTLLSDESNNQRCCRSYRTWSIPGYANHSILDAGLHTCLQHELWETLCSYINKIISLPTPMSGCIVSLTASFCSIYPQYLLFLSFFILFWWIELSPYQHQCCTVSLIASFCSINPQYLPFLSIFLHDFLVICQFEFVCNPNGMTAEPKSHGHPTKPQRESG